MTADGRVTTCSDLRTMRTFQENFDLSHRQLLETLTAYATVEAEPHLSNLCARLDFNGYYSSYCAHVLSFGGDP